MIPQEDIDHWQGVWKKLLDIAYYGKQPDGWLSHPPINPEWKHDPDFDKLTFDYMWSQYSERRDENHEYIEPRVDTTLTRLTVPYDLFYCLGVSSFMRKCFPNCNIVYWE